MPDPSSDQCSHAFGEFTLDVNRGTLFRAGTELHLRPKSFEVLRYLVERPGQLVTKGELMDAVWGRTVVTEGSLTQCIIDIRRALGAADAHIVRTVPRRGFVFAPPAPAPADLPPARRETSSKHGPTPLESRRPPGGWWLGALGAAAILVGATISAWLLAERADEPAAAGAAPGLTAAPANSIAVLRFLDLSPDGNQGYFADGLAEEILHLLAQSPALRVTARGSAFAFEPGDADVGEIARQLGVNYVVEGSVRRESDSLRATVQLIDARTEAHVWSRAYDRVVGGMLDLQSEIASDVAAALHVSLAPTPHSNSPSAAEAHEHYLLGRHLFLRRGPGELAAAERHLEQAVQLDPQHARAWAALAGAYHVRALDELRDPGYRLEEQRQAIERALEIDPGLAEAHVRLARYYGLQGQTTEMWAAFDRARQLAPSDPLVLATLAHLAAREGRLEHAIELQRRIVGLDPLSAIYRGNLGRMLLGAGRLEQALAELRRAQALSPGATDLPDDIELTLILLGRMADARQAITSRSGTARRDQLLVLLDDPPEANAALQRLSADPSARGRLMLAEIAAYRSEADAAFEHLEDARVAFAATPAGNEFDLPVEVAISPLLSPLRDDPRWGSLREALTAR